MRRIRTIGLVIYLVAAIVVLGTFAGSLFGPYTERVAELIASPTAHAVLGVCLALLAPHVLATLVGLVASRPEPAAMRLAGNPDIEVSVDALASVARAAAARSDVLVEQVEARVTGCDKHGVRIKIEVIALVPQNLNGLAQRVQTHVQEALDQMLGVPGAVVQVRFLPSKTTSVTKEVAGE